MIVDYRSELKYYIIYKFLEVIHSNLVHKNLFLQNVHLHLDLTGENNQLFLKAWDGNMDLQFCFDTYAVITYVTDYYSKDESGITEHLKMALKESNSKNMSLRQTMHHLKRGYMSKRQIGQCEAIYRVLPELHLKKTKCQKYLCVEWLS